MDERLTALAIEDQRHMRNMLCAAFFGARTVSYGRHEIAWQMACILNPVRSGPGNGAHEYDLTY